MPYITISNLVTFAPNVGVMVNREALASSPKQLFEAVRIAFSHMEDEHLANACCGGSGPLVGLGEISYESYLKLLEQIRIQESAQTAKKAHTKIRRTDFNQKRSILLLTMIESGVPHVCALGGCGEYQNLTIDHIVPFRMAAPMTCRIFDFCAVHITVQKGIGKMTDKQEAVACSFCRGAMGSRM